MKGTVKMNNRIMTVNVAVNNLPSKQPTGYMVARLVDGILWYYGTYDEQERADDVAKELGNGVVMLVG